MKITALLTAAVLVVSAMPMTSVTAFAKLNSQLTAIEETFEWLPETLDEYETFVEENGMVSVHGRYIVYCDKVCGSLGESVIMEQTGTAEIKGIKRYGIETENQPDGAAVDMVYVYEAVSSGTVEVTISKGILWNPNAEKELKDFGKYEVSEDLTITEVDNTRYGIGVSTPPAKTEYAIGEKLDLTGLRLNGSIRKFEDGAELQGCIIDEDYFDLIERGNAISIDSSEFNNQKAGTYNIYVLFGGAKDSFKVTVADGKTDYIKGDVNADGKFTVADVVMLQKWLLGVPDVTLFNWSSADLCEDGELNVFDLCMMKRGLINQGQYSDEPVLLIDDSRIYKTETGYDDNPYTRLITADGDMYSKRVCDCAYLSFEDHMNHVKAEGEKENLITDAEVLKKITEFSQNAAQYKDCKMKTADDYKVVDYGQIDLSVLYRDENGELQLLRLYGYGENPMILDNPEVKDFVKLLIEKDHIDGLAFWEEEIPVDYPNITMNDIIIFAEKGSDMRLADLEGFECVDIGAGNHTFLYDTADGRFRLSIGSANGKDIGYAKLECFESGEIIDISKESVEEFYNKNTFIAEKDIVMPDVEVEYGMPFGIRGGDSGLYAALSTDAPVSAYIPKWNMLHEIGYQEGNNDWIFTEYNGIKGWVRVKDDKGNSNLEYMAAPAKPVIYLYPEQETDVHVELDLKNAALSTTYPKYNGGWDVTAMPDGTLINKVDGTKHSYLFWDACNDSTRYDFSKGFCVAGEDTEAFLKEKLTYMGLNEQEMNEFIVYWLPLMEHNAYNLISFQTDAYTDNAKLNITPNPDSLLRIFMTYIPLDEAVEIAPQQLETFERKGFTVVEWGGAEIKR